MHSLANLLQFCHLRSAILPTAASGAHAAGAAAAPDRLASPTPGLGSGNSNGAGNNAGLGSSGSSTVGSAQEPLLSQEGMDLLAATPELDYLTHLVLRLYEDMAVPANDPARFKIEILFTPGASHDPTQV